MKSIVLVDFDNTLCMNTKSGVGISPDEIFDGSYPNTELIEAMRYKESDFDYIIFTSRGQLSYNGDSQKAKEIYGPLIEKWLIDNHVPYKDISFNKPNCFYIVDDCAMDPDTFCIQFHPEMEPETNDTWDYILTDEEVKSLLGGLDKLCSEDQEKQDLADNLIDKGSF